MERTWGKCGKKEGSREGGRSGEREEERKRKKKTKNGNKWMNCMSPPTQHIFFTLLYHLQMV